MDAALSWLIDPLSEAEPCGESLEDTQLLASFDAYRVFGQIAPPSADTDWRDIRNSAEEALKQSKDFRLLAHLALARLHMEGLTSFCGLLGVAGQWLQQYPDHVYPRIDDDAILRKNALNCLADPLAMGDAVRKLPFLKNPQLGAFGLRDFEIAKGKVPPPEGKEAPNEAHLNAVVTAVAPEVLAALNEALLEGTYALKGMGVTMREAHGIEGSPDFDSVLGPLVEIQRIVQAEIDARAAQAALADVQGDGQAEGGAQAGGPGAVISVGSIRSREDAIRALDAVAAFFTKNEPSSPVPLLVERAKGLVGKGFLDLLADIAPDGFDQAKNWGPKEE
jgi:type VI secretion system protein ImpA